jgi:peptide/nickel transport system permease protein
MTPSGELTPIAALTTLGSARRARWIAVVGLPAGRIGFALLGLVVALAALAPQIAPHDPFALTGRPLLAPSIRHVMGTDALGRDVFSGILYGARTSLLVGMAAALIAFLFGVSVGIVAGYRGGVIDSLLMRLTELFQVLPRFFLVVIAVALFGAGVDRLILTLGLTSWPVLARVVRSEVVSMCELDFIRAAKATGGSNVRIIWRELLPNVIPSAIVLLGLTFGQVLLVEGSLGFLGLGDPNALSWGQLASQSQGFLRVAWWLAFFPGLAITVAVVGANLAADALSTAFPGGPAVGASGRLPDRFSATGLASASVANGSVHTRS